MCVMTDALASHLIEVCGDDGIALRATHATFHTLYDFRDTVLKPTSVGAEILELYRTHSGTVLEAIRHDRLLLLGMLEMLITGAAYARYLIRVEDGNREARFTDVRLRTDIVEEASAMLSRVRDLVGDDLNEALDYAQTILTRCAGRSVPEILGILSGTAAV